jgi:acid phosphatase
VRPTRLATVVAVVLTAVAAVAGCSPAHPVAAPPRHVAAAVPHRPAARQAAAVPRPAHVVVVIFENKAASRVLGNSRAPYLTALARLGATFSHSYAVTHPSEPNYLALFSGSTQGVTSDRCPVTLPRTDNLGRQLSAAHRTFAGYSEGMPRPGYTGCTGSNGRYARKHNPWVDFGTVPASANRTFAQFPADYATLPDVSFVVPDMCHDMHDCSVATGDAWARRYLAPYVRWARAHNSLLIVTFDEDDGSAGNRIATFFVGQHTRKGTYAGRIDHYTVLRTIEAMFGLPALGNARHRSPITGVWTG